jgi:hypothetical protein
MSYKDSSMVSKGYALSLCLALALTVLLDSPRRQSLIVKKKRQKPDLRGVSAAKFQKFTISGFENGRNPTHLVTKT